MSTSRLGAKEVARYKKLSAEDRQRIAEKTDSTRQWVWEVLTGRAKKTSTRAQLIISEANKKLNGASK